MFNRILFLCMLCSFFACQKVVIQKNYVQISCTAGPEDIVLDKVNKRILISCNERRQGMIQKGEIQQLNLDNDQCTTLPLIGLPSIPFNPHGFDLQTINGQSYLYVVNHYKDASNTNSVIQFKVHATDLEYVKEYKHPLLLSPNDLTVLPNGSFYFTNDRNSPDVLELITNPSSGSVVYCDGRDNWKKVDSFIAFPNGLYNEGGVLFLATSRNHALFTYDVQTDGTLIHKRILSKINGMDNITINRDQLIVAVHPDEVKFALLSYNPSTLSPCKTYSINKYTGVATLLFSDEGNRISGSSTALVVGSNLYLSQVFAPFILKITHFED